MENFAKAVLKRLSDVSPPSLVASIIQACVIIPIIWFISESFEKIIHEHSFYKDVGWTNIFSAFPTINFWLLITIFLIGTALLLYFVGMSYLFWIVLTNRTVLSIIVIYILVYAAVLWLPAILSKIVGITGLIVTIIIICSRGDGGRGSGRGSGSGSGGAVIDPKKMF